MSFFPVSILIAGFSLALAGQAEYPVPPTGTRINPPDAPAEPGSRETTDAARRILADFARCTVARNPRGVQRYLASMPGSPESTELANRITNHECLTEGQLHFGQSLYRGALYEALYRHEYIRRPSLPLATAPQVAYFAVPSSPLTDAQRGWANLATFGDCVVRAAPAQARALVLSEIAGLDEDRALAALNPALGPCLPAGVQLSFSLPILRGLMAQSLYRLSAAAAPAATGATR